MADLRIHGGHDAWEKLDHGRREPTFLQSLGHFEADESATDHDGGAGLVLLDIGVHAVHVGNRPQLEDVGRVGAWHGRRDRIAALGEDELVIGQPRLAVLAAHENLLARPIDLDGLGCKQDAYSVAGIEALRRLQEQL